MVVFEICDGVRVILENENGRNYDYCYLCNALHQLPKTEYHSREYGEMYSKAMSIAEKYYGEKEFEGLYWALMNYEDDRYYHENIDAFHEYCTHMNEPDFDWGFYSDWHKDLFGFRPR